MHSSEDFFRMHVSRATRTFVSADNQKVNTPSTQKKNYTGVRPLHHYRVRFSPRDSDPLQGLNSCTLGYILKNNPPFPIYKV